MTPSPPSSQAARQVEVNLSYLQWELQVEQEREQFNVVNGGRRIHKTDHAIKTLLSRTMARAPGSLGVYLNRTHKQAKAVAWKRLLAYLAKPHDWMLGGEPNVNELTIPLMEGRTIQLIGCEEIDSQRGIGPSVAVFDEVAHNRYAEPMWREVIGPALTDKEGEAYFYSSPKGRTFFYRLHRRGLPGPGKRNGWRSWTFTTPEVGTVPEWELEEKKRENEETYRQEFLAEFLGYAGLAIHEFVPRVWPEGNLLPQGDWERIRKGFIGVGGIDYAWSSGSTARVVYGVDDTGRIIGVHEMILPGGNPQRLAGRMAVADASLWSRPLYNVMGRDSFAKLSQGLSTADQLGHLGVPVVRCPYLLEDAVSRMNDLCLPRKGEGDEGMPGFMIVNGTCPRLIAQMSTIQSEDLEKGTQHLKDALDTARMVVAMQIRARGAEPRDRIARNQQRFDEAMLASLIQEEGAGSFHPVSGRPLD